MGVARHADRTNAAGLQSPSGEKRRRQQRDERDHGPEPVQILGVAGLCLRFGIVVGRSGSGTSIWVTEIERPGEEPVAEGSEL
jgi:hypothetical protein|nr:hypothetical protein [Natronomonas aquatica]